MILWAGIDRQTSRWWFSHEDNSRVKSTLKEQLSRLLRRLIIQKIQRQALSPKNISWLVLETSSNRIRGLSLPCDTSSFSTFCQRGSEATEHWYEVQMSPSHFCRENMRVTSLHSFTRVNIFWFSSAGKQLLVTK